ncbi:DUF6037 family protein [Lysinibacillus sphaericus]|uniref:DUF6037 family protein n=1 Tax=Lysinibacillus sphaericus TaxID=1421 RepID=UPI00382B6324
MSNVQETEVILLNLKLLRDDMANKGWIIDSFDFIYKKKPYIVLVKRFTKNHTKKNQWALVELEFIDTNDFFNVLKVEANSVKLFVSTTDLRNYFGIEPNPNQGELHEQFKIQLARFIPTSVIEKKLDSHKNAIVKSLSKSDSEDPTKVYINHVKRSGKKEDGTNKERSIYNDNKARVLCETVYERFKVDKTISFYFFSEKSKFKTYQEILANWNKNKHS